MPASSWVLFNIVTTKKCRMFIEKTIFMAGHHFTEIAIPQSKNNVG